MKYTFTEYEFDQISKYADSIEIFIDKYLENAADKYAWELGVILAITDQFKKLLKGKRDEVVCNRE